MQTEEMEEMLRLQILEEWVAMEEAEGDIVLFLMVLPLVIMEAEEAEAIPEEGQEDLTNIILEEVAKPVAVAAHILIRDN